MKKVKISLSSIDTVKSFVTLTTKIEGDVTIISGRYIIDAKSIMGIFSLDLSKPLDLEIEEWKDEYEDALKPYMID